MVRSQIGMCFVVLLAFNASAQQTPAVEFALTASNGSSARTLYFGLDPVATDGRVTILGESELPPAPPSGVYDMRFTLQHVGFPSIQGLERDYRQGSMSTVGTRHHRLKFQRTAGQDTITFAWNFPNGVVGTLQDLFGGIIVNQPMTGSGNYRLGHLGISELDMFIEYDGSLPIQLASFTATVIEGGRVRLDWTTPTETNNYGFEVQKSLQALTGFETIPNSFIQGQGTTIEPHDYSFVDEAATPGSWFSRLKQIDLDGSIHYTDPIQVEILAGVDGIQTTPLQFMLGQNYPNPFNPSTSIAYSIAASQKVALKVFDMLGREVTTLVNEIQPAGSYTITWDASEVAGGVYFYRIESGSFSAVRSVIFLK